jgi:hypothetical protein
VKHVWFREDVHHHFIRINWNFCVNIIHQTCQDAAIPWPAVAPFCSLRHMSRLRKLQKKSVPMGAWNMNYEVPKLGTNHCTTKFICDFCMNWDLFICTLFGLPCQVTSVRHPDHVTGAWARSPPTSLHSLKSKKTKIGVKAGNQT